MAKTPKPKRTNKVTATQVLSWNEFKDSPKRLTQTVRTLNYLTANVANSRQIAEALKIERPSVTRVLNDLWRKGTIRISKEAKCATTGRKTQFYTLANQEDAGGAQAQPGASMAIQGDLFTQPRNAA